MKHGRLRGVAVRLADDQSFVDMGDDGMLLYFFAKLQSGPFGIARLDSGRLTAQLRWVKGRIKKAMEVNRTAGLIAWQGDVMWVLDGLSEEPSINLSHHLQRRGVEDYLRTLPPFEIVNEYATFHGLEVPFATVGYSEVLGIFSGRIRKPLNTNGASPKPFMSSSKSVSVIPELPGITTEKENKTSSGAKAPTESKAKKNPAEFLHDIAIELWAIYRAEMPLPPALKLNDIRKTKLVALFQEHLRKLEDPAEGMKAVCRAIKNHPWWGIRPATWWPEKCLRNEARREEFALLATNQISQEVVDADTRGTQGEDSGAQGRGRARYGQYVNRTG